MASLWRHPKTKYWHACFTDSRGMRRKVSTRRTDRAEALEIAADLDGAFREMRAAEQRGNGKDATAGVKPAALSADAYLTQWLAGKKSSRVAKGSLKVYALCAGRLRQSLGTEVQSPVTAITQKQLDEFRDWLTGTLELSPKSVLLHCQVARMILKSARQDHGGETPPKSELPPAQGSKRKTPAFTARQFLALIGHLSGEMKTLTLLGAYTGARLGDLQLLKWEDVDSENGAISFRIGRTKRLLRVPVAPPLLRHLEGLERTGGHVMPGLAAERTSAVGMAFADMLKKHGAGRRREIRGAGIRKNTGLSFHGFQRSLMSMPDAAGAPMSMAVVPSGVAGSG